MTVHDLQALRDEALAGAGGETYRQGYEVQFNGIVFRVPPQRLWPVRALRHLRLGEVDLGLEILLGRDTAEQLLDAGIVLDDVERLAGLGGAAAPPSMRSSAVGR